MGAQLFKPLAQNVGTEPPPIIEDPVQQHLYLRLLFQAVETKIMEARL